VSRREGITEVEASERGSSASTLVPTVLGFPRWIFWGIAMPWFAASTFTIGFALRGIRLETNDASEKHQQAIGNTSGEPAGSGGDPR
jgi:hypothetical protein